MTALHNTSSGESSSASIIEKTDQSTSNTRAAAASALHHARMQSLELALRLEEQNKQVKVLTTENGFLRKENAILKNRVENLTETNASLQAINTDQEVQLAENEIELQRLKNEAGQSGHPLYRFAAEAEENVMALKGVLESAFNWFIS